MRLATAAALIVLVAAANATAQSTPARTPRLRTTLDSLARDFAANSTVPGTAVAVVRGRDTLLFKAYGSANLELGVPMTTRSVFRIGSVTKQFASAAIMQLVQEGKLALTDTIGQWLSDLPPAWRGVTITNLLNHTSGIPSYTEAGERWMKRWGEEMSSADLIALTASTPMDFAVGSAWRYNNTGYVLLGMLIESRTGRSWHEDLAARFFAPLGLSQTRYCDNRPLIPGRASGYSRNERDEWVNTRYLAMSQPHAAGALCSTIGDVLTWNRALHGGRVVSASSYAAMTTPVGAAVGNKYGFGLGIEDIGGHRIVTHTGGINGSLTANLFVPDAQLSVTVLTNGDFTGPDRFAKQLARAALGVPLDVPPRAITLTAAQMAPYLGVYSLVLESPHPFTVLAKDGALYAMLDDQSPEKLIPFGNNTFGAVFDPTVRLVFAVADGKATGFTLQQRGKEFAATRRP
jgi:D-alanyl-D-alanine carboxypeptidase